MSLRKLHRSHLTRYVFVLWSDHFEEEVATIFVTELRRIGLCVKVLGLTGTQAVGLHGMTLSSDVTLSQALDLADKAVGVIVPCNAAILHRLEDDPRLREFFQIAINSQARFIVSNGDVVARSSLDRLVIPAAQLTFYQDHPNLIEFAQRTAVAFTNATAV